ncbi:MAG: hypothetical protein HYV32_02640 [Candidatus Kerfeldbacteria bacterium]|nr:hypothetical protein [Candidatus Kerfeldbacteria bacterium]
MHTQQQETIISTREFIRHFADITQKPLQKTYTVVKHGKPIGIFMPLNAPTKRLKKSITLADLEKRRFRSRTTNLSEQIDKIVYGIGR